MDLCGGEREENKEKPLSGKQIENFVAEIAIYSR